MQPLASAGTSRSQSNTNLSTSVALSLFDANGNEVAVRTDPDHPIELIIPRDPNRVIPPMALQNVTSLADSPHRQLFNLHFINITSQLPISVHFEMRPRNTNLAYLTIYRFDSAPQLNSSVNLIDGWTAFCPSNLSQERYLHLLPRQSTDTWTSVGDLRPPRDEYYRLPYESPPTDQRRALELLGPTTNCACIHRAATISTRTNNGKEMVSWWDR